MPFFKLVSYPTLSEHSKSQSANGKHLIDGYVAVTIPGEYHNHDELAHVYLAETRIHNHNHNGTTYITHYSRIGDIHISPNGGSLLFGIMDSEGVRTKLNTDRAFNAGHDKCLEKLDKELPDIIEDFLRFRPPFNGLAKPIIMSAALACAIAAKYKAS